LLGPFAIGLFLGALFWVGDSIYGYVAFAARVRFLLFEQPLSLWDSFWARIPPHDLYIRVAFIVVAMVSALIVSIFLLRRSQAQERISFQASLLDAVNEAVIVTDPSGEIMYWNPAAERLYGWSQSEAIGQNIADVTVPAISQEMANEIMGKLRSGMTWTGEFECRRRDGTIFEAYVSDTPIYNIKRELAAIIGLSTDITERRQMELRLRQAQKLESIGTLASGVAHEINNPLMGMMNYAELARDRIDDVKAQGYLDEAKIEGRRIAKIVSSLLSFAAPQSEEHSPARVRDIVEQAMSLVRSHIKRSQIDLRVDIPTDLPNVRCRSGQIMQVIINLLTNAVDALNARYDGFHEDKQLVLSARLVSASGGDRAEICVEDYGKGIEAAALDRIFDPFYTSKCRTKGTGLGLSISYGIAQEHGGRLVADSVEGEYTRFSFTLPTA